MYVTVQEATHDASLKIAEEIHVLIKDVLQLASFPMNYISKIAENLNRLLEVMKVRSCLKNKWLKIATSKTRQTTFQELQGPFT